MNGVNGSHSDNKELKPDSKWVTRIRTASNSNIDYEEGSSSSHGHYITKSEVDSSDDQMSGDEQSFHHGFDLSRKPLGLSAVGYDRRDGNTLHEGQLVLSGGHGSSFLSGHNTGGVPEDASRKREMRLQKNKEAAKECRRKKKEYVKCLENRVMVLEAQNKTLIDELKALKELYCQRDSKH